MTPVVFACRLVLATVFLLAAGAKAVDRTETRRTIEPFVPPWIASVLTGLLPVVELAIGLALLDRRWAWTGAITAVPLLLLFLAVMGVNLARGYVPSCGCFGKLGSRAPAIGTIVRNELLIALAIFVAVAGRIDAGGDVVTWLRALPVWSRAGLIALLIALALVVEWAPLVPRAARGVTQLLRRARTSDKGDISPVGAHRRPSELPPSGLEPGAHAPGVALDPGGGPPLTLEDVLAQRRRAVLVFFDAGCTSCEAVRSRLARWQEIHADRFAVVTVGSEGCACDGRAREARLAYRVQAVPSAVLIDLNGRIASRVATGPAAIDALTTAIA
jgi:Methylamine utilisation protein MauE